MSRIKRALMFCLLALLILPPALQAEVKVFIREYTYEASRLDTKESCQVIALEQVKRLLLEELGTYLESQTEVVDYRLSKERVTILSAGIVRTQILKDRWQSQTYWLQAKIATDPRDLARSLDALRRDHTRTRELEETRKKADLALQEIARLKKELDSAKADRGRASRYEDVVRDLRATDWFERGVAMTLTGKVPEAVEAFSAAIRLKPDYLLAYNNRGISEALRGRHPQAIRDFDRVIRLDSGNVSAYNNRGVSRGKTGQYQEALKDYRKGLALNPRDEAIPYNMACTYALMGDPARACEWLSKAIQNGFTDWESIREDKDLEGIRQAPCYRQILDRSPGPGRRPGAARPEPRPSGP